MHLFQEMDSVLQFTLLLCGFGIGATLRISKGSEEVASGSGVHCKCLAGWTPYRGLCYLFDDTELDWIKAELNCISHYGNLATIQNKDQYTFMRSLIFKSSGSHTQTWVGGYDAVKEGVWLWSKGSKFDFNNWASGQPNNYGGNENCMEINHLGQDYVNDNNCNHKNSFICVRHP